MSPFLIPITALMIPIVALVGSLIVRPWMQMKHRQMEIDAELARERLAVDNARQERLEQRIAVLERIVTDRGGALADEIERLRDAPLN